MKIKVKANAGKNEIIGFMDQDTLKIKIKAPAVDNKANKELISFLSKTMNLSKNNIEIISGFGNPLKLLRLTGITRLGADSIIQEKISLKK
ncbi:YggU family protein [Candidatus Dependentiae bacterium]|nr:YggU family protein [Candidatus Dependentiae bacterium]